MKKTVVKENNNNIQKLNNLNSIIGDYHTHTDNSDGKDTVEDMIRTASNIGLQEIAITDHGHNKWFGGLKPKKYSMVKALVEKSAAEHNIKAYFGIEANVTGTNGQIDVDIDDRANMDILLCGVHRLVHSANIKTLFTFFIPNWFWGIIRYTPKGRIRKNTEVMKRVIANNNIDIWAHPNRYFRLDVVEVAKICADRGTLIELNGKHISFRPIDFERMAAIDAKFIIGSDAHRTGRIASVNKVFEFLKLCDYNQDDIVNINGVFHRSKPKGIQLIDEQPVIDIPNKTKTKKEKKKQKRSK